MIGEPSIRRTPMNIVTIPQTIPSKVQSAMINLEESLIKISSLWKRIIQISIKTGMTTTNKMENIAISKEIMQGKEVLT